MEHWPGSGWAHDAVDLNMHDWDEYMDCWGPVAAEGDFGGPNGSNEYCGFIDDATLVEMKKQFNILTVEKLSPVLPVLSRSGLQIPFTTCKQMLDQKESSGKSLCEMALVYECARGNLTEQDVFKRMNEIVRIMRNCVERGLKGTDYEDRILGRQSDLFLLQPRLSG